MSWCQSLQYTVSLPERISRTAGDDDPELWRDDIEPLRSIFADQNLLQALAFFRDLRLDDFLDTLQVGSKALARTRFPFWPILADLAKLTVNRGKFSLDLLEGEVDLVVVDRQPQTLGPRSFLGTLQNLQDRRQIGDPLVGLLLGNLHSSDFSNVRP